jgi:pSer/pThr/pTyr-binding forkhead associated (FHA) protein
MITCPACRNIELEGTLICSECGSQLFHPDDIIFSSPVNLFDDVPQDDSINEAVTTNDHVAPFDTYASFDPFLVFVDLDVNFPLTGNTDFTIGRISGSQPILPDIDLSNFKGYEEGVSRLHATIKIKDSQITIMDLGSANGTRINGRKILAHESQSLNHGDIITLGKFKIQVFTHKE